MNWEDWTLQTIGLYGNGKYLDDIEEDFGVEVFDTEDEMLEIIKLASNEKRPRLGDRIASELFRAIIERATKELENAKEEDFDFVCNGVLDTQLYCKEEVVSSWDDIVEIYEKEDTL